MREPTTWADSDAGRLGAAFERLVFTLVRQRGPNPREAASLLAPTQTLALTAVVDDGPLRLGQLALRLGSTDATATRTADSLEALGLVERVADAGDRRATLLAATERGRESVAGRRSRLTSLFEDALGSDADVERFIALIDDLDGLVDPAHHRNAVA